MAVKKERYVTGEKALTPKEYEKLISVIDRLEDEVLIKLAVSIGARREDITNINISDVNMDDLSIAFYEAKKRRIRIVPISQEMARLIKQLINTRGKDPDPRLFRFTGRTAYTRLQNYCKRAGIPCRPFHALRATCVKRCQAAGWTIEQVSRLTGDTVAVIQEHYAFPSASEMAEVAQSKPVI